MKQLLLIFTCIIVCKLSFSQEREFDTLNSTTRYAGAVLNSVEDSANKLLKRYVSIEQGFLTGTTNPSGFKVMPDIYFDKFIGKYFSYTVTSKAGLPDGNSISITPSTNATTLTTNISRRSNSTILNAGFTADFSDNVANVLSGSNVTANTTFYTNVSILRRKHSLIQFDANEAMNTNQNKKMAVRQFLNNFNMKYKVSYKNDLQAYQTTVSMLDNYLSQPARVQQIDTIASKIISLQNDLSTEITKIKAYGLNEYSGMYGTNKLHVKMAKQFEDSLNAIIDNMELNTAAWQKFRFSWFSGGLSYTRQQYKTYDGNVQFDQRISSLPFNNASLTLGYNYISQHSKSYSESFKGVESFYLSTAYTVGNDLNYSHVDAQDLAVLSSVSNSGTTYQFQDVSKVRDITGIQKQTDWLHTLAVQTTLVFPNTNFMGFNTGLTASYGKFTTPIYSGKLGLLFRFTNSDDQTAKLNFELFLKLTDWNDSMGTGKTTWQRKSIGFNTTIPFSKLFF